MSTCSFGFGLAGVIRRFDPSSVRNSWMVSADRQMTLSFPRLSPAPGRHLGNTNSATQSCRPPPSCISGSVGEIPKDELAIPGSPPLPRAALKMLSPPDMRKPPPRCQPRRFSNLTSRCLEGEVNASEPTSLQMQAANPKTARLSPAA
jgi:hypothetical protein